MNKFGDNLRKYRKEKKLTQEKLADLLNVSFQTVSKWEKKKTEPNIDTLIKIASIFNITLDELVGVRK